MVCVLGTNLCAVVGLPPSLELRTVAGMGRGVFTISAGDTIFSALPIAHCSVEETRGTICEHCFNTSKWVLQSLQVETFLFCIDQLIFPYLIQYERCEKDWKWALIPGRERRPGILCMRMREIIYSNFIIQIVKNEQSYNTYMYDLASFPGRIERSWKIRPGIDCIWAWLKEPETKAEILVSLSCKSYRNVAPCMLSSIKI